MPADKCSTSAHLAVDAARLIATFVAASAMIGLSHSSGSRFQFYVGLALICLSPIVLTRGSIVVKAFAVAVVVVGGVATAASTYERVLLLPYRPAILEMSWSDGKCESVAAELKGEASEFVKLHVVQESTVEGATRIAVCPNGSLIDEHRYSVFFLLSPPATQDIPGYIVFTAGKCGSESVPLRSLYRPAPDEILSEVDSYKMMGECAGKSVFVYRHVLPRN